jgi:hypothetical protein
MSRRTIVGLTVAALVLAVAAVASADSGPQAWTDHLPLVDGGMIGMEMMSGDHMGTMSGDHMAEMATMMSEHHSTMGDSVGHMTEMTPMMLNSGPMGSMGSDHAGHHSP